MGRILKLLLVSVSYTHLDVYKRQERGNRQQRNHPHHRPTDIQQGPQTGQQVKWCGRQPYVGGIHGKTSKKQAALLLGESDGLFKFGADRWAAVSALA